ncbi:MAG TPA: hemerythrin domain-containing protein [Bacteroidota bacterium]|nr:hemerythrin domain-containing protein [Bacteroidota bacterium]
MRDESVINKYFTKDHRRLESLLHRAFNSRENIDETAYAEFRSGLLKHIAMEEKILIPALSNVRDGAPYPLAAQLRLEHGAIASLLVLPPSVTVKNVLLGILQHHNKREESESGLYSDCDCLLSNAPENIMQKTMRYPDVPVMPYNDSPHAHDAARRAVARAGYDFDTLMNTPTI